MPIVRHNGKEIHIEWDPDQVADLILQGYEVAPDPGTDKLTLDYHNQQLEPRLRRRWGQTKFIPERPKEAPKHIPKRPTPPATTVGEDPEPSYPGGGVSLNIAPNPYVEFTGKQIDRGTLQDYYNMLNFSRNPKKPIDL